MHDDVPSWLKADPMYDRARHLDERAIDTAIERAAIRQYDGGQWRADAEDAAMREAKGKT